MSEASGSVQNCQKLKDHIIITQSTMQNVQRVEEEKTSCLVRTFSTLDIQPYIGMCTSADATRRDMLRYDAKVVMVGSGLFFIIMLEVYRSDSHKNWHTCGRYKM